MARFHPTGFSGWNPSMMQTHSPEEGAPSGVPVVPERTSQTASVPGLKLSPGGPQVR